MSAKMTLEEIEALAKGATPGPWMLETGDAAPIGNVETIDGHLVLQAQQNLTVKGSDYVGQNAMRNANARFAAQVWRLLEIAQEMRAEVENLRKAIRLANARLMAEEATTVTMNLKLSGDEWARDILAPICEGEIG